MHRDLKPQDILLIADTIEIGGFGLSRNVRLIGAAMESIDLFGAAIGVEHNSAVAEAEELLNFCSPDACCTLFYCQTN